MPAVREAIYAWIEDQLADQDKGEVRRMPGTDPVKYPARHIFDGGHRIIENDPFCTRYSMSARVEGYVEGAEGAVAHATLHQLYVDTIEALVTDPPADGLAETIDEGDMEIIVAPLGGKSRLCFILDIPITFSAARGNPAEQA